MHGQQVLEDGAKPKRATNSHARQEKGWKCGLGPVDLFSICLPTADSSAAPSSAIAKSQENRTASTTTQHPAQSTGEQRAQRAHRELSFESQTSCSRQRYSLVPLDASNSRFLDEISYAIRPPGIMAARRARASASDYSMQSRNGQGGRRSATPSTMMGTMMYRESLCMHDRRPPAGPSHLECSGIKRLANVMPVLLAPVHPMVVVHAWPLACHSYPAARLLWVRATECSLCGA